MGSCQASVSPASASSRRPLVISTEARKRTTGRTIGPPRDTPSSLGSFARRPSGGYPSRAYPAAIQSNEQELTPPDGKADVPASGCQVRSRQPLGGGAQGARRQDAERASHQV